MVTAEEAVAGALVLKKESHHSAENASNSDQEGNTPAVPKKPSEDGYNWRKYGQKSVKRNEYIRSYYKCSYHNCQVKKQVEHAHDGRITDTTYFGEHDHPKPQNNLPNTIPFVVSVKVQIADSRSSTVAEDNSSSAHPLMVEEVEPKDTNKLAIGTEGKDQAPSPPSETKDDENKNNKLVPKRRKKSSDDAEPVVDKPGNKSCHVVETVSAVDIVNDGYKWRKYGQKLVKGNQHPRSYYRCSNPGCLVKKHVERAFRDPKVVITTYEGKHIHNIPPVRTMLPHGKPPSLCASSDTVDERVMEESKGDVVAGGTKADKRGVEAEIELQGEKVSQADFDDVGDDEGETKESKVSRKGRPRKGRQLPKKTYPSRSRELASAAKSPFCNMDEQKLAKKITKNSKVEGMTDLVKWMQSESIEPRIGPTGQPLDKKFFEKLFAPKVWLVSEHLEQMMFLYRQRISEDPERFSKVVVLDAFWQTLVTIEFNRFQKNFLRKGEDAVMKYMMGSCPTGFGKRWDDAERIYVPFNISDSHWLALEIKLCDWGVTVYDCNVDLYSDKKIFDMIQPVVQTVQRYVKMYESLAKRCEPLLDKPMSVSRRDNIKQNKRGGDCGVYTLKHIELLMLDMTNLDLASDKFIDGYRNQMVHSIFRCCWDGF